MIPDDHPKGEVGASPATRSLQLEAWRREADHWQKRIERSDDQVGGLLTACLTVGGIGTAAAGYVQTHAHDKLWMVEVGVGLVAVAGLITLVSRTILSSGWLKRAGHAAPSATATAECEFVTAEKGNASNREKAAKRRERAVGLALFIWAAGLILIALAGASALD
jgi:hypothetical protein